MPPTKRELYKLRTTNPLKCQEKVIMRKKSVAYEKGLFQPYPKGTLGYDLFRVINEQILPDTVLDVMVGWGSGVINKLRLKRRDPETMKIVTMNKLLNRCGYKLAIVKMNEDDDAEEKQGS